jgi:3-oxoacyl-[acyl-carrier protein] reductase
MATNQKPIVITGASGGIGLDLIPHLVEAGYRDVALQCYRGADRLEGLAKRLGLDPQRHVFSANLTQEDDVTRFGSLVRANFGTPWAVINLAGSTSNSVSWKLSLDEFRRVVAASLDTTFLTCREFIPSMRVAGQGRIVNVSSVVAYAGGPGASHYAAGKAGVVGFSKSLALEVAGKGITVNTVALGYFDRGMIKTIPQPVVDSIMSRIPAQRLGNVSEVAALIQYLLDERSAYVTGQVLHLNGGYYL